MGTYNSKYKNSKLAVGKKEYQSSYNANRHLHVAMLFAVMLIQGLAVNIFFRKKMT